MANRNLRYVIEADSTQAVAETKKVNTEIEKTGPTAERNTRQAAAGFGSMTAQIMAASGGLKQFQSQHDAFTAALIRDARATADVFGSVGDAVGGFAHFLEQSGKAAVAGVLAFKSYATVVGGYSTAIASAGSGTSSFVDAYRVLRIALSPTPFSVVSVAAGILTEEIIGTTLETGKLIEVRANLAARTGIDVQTLTTLADASKLAGKSSEYYLDTLTKLKAQQQSGTAAAGLTTLGLSADAKATPLLLGQIGEAFDRLRDPQQRAQVAFQLFGSEFEKVLPQLNERLRESTVEALAFSRVLTNEEATSIDLVKRRIDSLKDTFGGFFGYFRIEVQNFKTELSLATAEVLNFTTELLRLQVLPEAGASSKSGISAADAKRLADDARGFGRTRLAGSGSSALSDINAPGLNAIQDRLDNSKEGISAALSEQQNIRKTSLAALAVPGVSVIDKDVLARKAFAADSEAAQLQERLKGLEDADNARKTVEAEAKALRTAIASRQKSIRDDLATAQASLLDPFARSIAEFDKHGVDLVNVKSGDKIVQRPLGDDEVSARNQTLQAIVTGHQKEQLKQAAEAAQSLYQLQLGYESGLFQKRTELRIQDDQRQIDAATKLQEYRLEEFGRGS